MSEPLDLGRFELCLNVRDLSASLEFYGRLGFGRVGGDPGDGWAVLRNGDCIISLFRGHITENLLNFRGADVFALAAELKKRGVQMDSDAEHEGDGTDGATIRDPDGNLIYFNTP